MKDKKQAESHQNQQDSCGNIWMEGLLGEAMGNCLIDFRKGLKSAKL